MRKIVCILVLAPAIQALAVTGSFRPVNNTFVLAPGVASPFANAINQNYGGSGALCVSSATARAYDPNVGIDHRPKGEFITLLKFNMPLCVGTSVSGLTLRLAITNGNQSANGIFNYLGSPGDFDLYWISSDWQQGYGTPNITAGSNVGITYHDLASLIERTPPVYLETLHYDAEYSYAQGENWFTFALHPDNGNYHGLLDAVKAGAAVTLMLSPSAGSRVCFNIRAYVQNAKDGTSTFRDTGPFLDVDTTLPDIAVDFDGNGAIDHADLACIVDHWMQKGTHLPGDIAPLGGDGVIDMLDLAEFMKHWPAYTAPTLGTN